MNARVKGLALRLLVVGLALWSSASLRAATGTFQTRLVTFSDSPDRIITFKVNPALGPGEAAALVLNFVTDGNPGMGTPPDPFPAPANVTFKLQYNNADITPDGGSPPFNFKSQDVATMNYQANSMAGHVAMIAQRKGPGSYSIQLTFPDGASILGGLNWTLTIGSIPTMPTIRGMAYIDPGNFVDLSMAGPCGNGTVCNPPPPCNCVKIDWSRYIYYVVDLHFPIGPDPCDFCPDPWNKPIPEGLDRAVVSLMPYVKQGVLLGQGRARDISLNIQGAQAVGPLFDAGGGQYYQMLEFRKGESPTVSATVAGMTSSVTSVVPGTSAGGTGIERYLAWIFGVLLLIALIVIATQRRGGVARG